MERREGDGFLTEGEVYRTSMVLQVLQVLQMWETLILFIYLAVVGLRGWASFL